MPVPQTLTELPYAPYLEPHDGELAPEQEYGAVHFRDAVFDDCEAANGHVTESAFTGVTFTGGTFRRARLSEVWLSRTRWVGTEWAETEWRDAVFLDSSLAGIPAYRSALRRTTFQECKIDTWNLRAGTLRDVVFDRCDLHEVDFGQATLSNVTFPGSTVRRARFNRTSLTKVDFRGAAELDVAEGADSLRGAVIGSGQLAGLAPVLARVMGIVVEDG